MEEEEEAAATPASETEAEFLKPEVEKEEMTGSSLVRKSVDDARLWTTALATVRLTRTLSSSMLLLLGCSDGDDDDDEADELLQGQSTK